MFPCCARVESQAEIPVFRGESPIVRLLDLEEHNHRHGADLQGIVAALKALSRGQRVGANGRLAPRLRHIGIYSHNSLRGVLELREERGRCVAEAALVVEEQWRGRGFGWALLQAAAERAGEANASKLRLIFSRQNWPMRQLARKANAKLDLVWDELRADIAIGPQFRLRTDPVA